MSLRVRTDVLLRNASGGFTGIRTSHRSLHKYTLTKVPTIAHTSSVSVPRHPRLSSSSSLSSFQRSRLRNTATSKSSQDRAMSTDTATTAPSKHKFFVYAPDFTDEECMQRRLAVRAQHLENAKKLADQGIIISGGALLTEASISSPDAPKKFVGSTMTCWAESIDDLKKIIQDDVYYKNKVWDPEKMVILPFLQAALN